MNALSRNSGEHDDSPEASKETYALVLNPLVTSRNEHALRMVRLRPLLLGSEDESGRTAIDTSPVRHFSRLYGPRGDEFTEYGYMQNVRRVMPGALHFVSESPGVTEADLVIDTTRESRRKSGFTGRPHNPAEWLRHIKAGGSARNPADEGLRHFKEVHSITPVTEQLGALTLPLRITFGVSGVSSEGTVYSEYGSDTRNHLIGIADIEVALGGGADITAEDSM